MPVTQLLVVVTRQDIDAARVSSNCRCPIACCLERLFSRSAIVNYDTRWQRDGSRVLHAQAQVGRRVWELPDVAVDFMRRFDEGCEVKPFSFKLEK